MMKILITGPECSGKTSLATALAKYHSSPLVPELARAYLTVKPTSYDRHDLESIAKNQLALEDSCTGLSVPYLFIDTSMLVFKIWSEYRYDFVSPFIRKSFEERIYDLCFLCEPVDPYVADDLRENPNDRWSLYYLYLKNLYLFGKKPLVLNGNEEQRFRSALNLIDQFT